MSLNKGQRDSFGGFMCIPTNSILGKGGHMTLLTQQEKDFLS